MFISRIIRFGVLSSVLALVNIISSSNGALAFSNVLGSRDTYPAPYVVPSTEQWDGNDGPWSTFAIQIGTPPQTLKVLISTGGTQTLAVAPEGCISEDPLDCKKLRGEFFNYNDSSTYSRNLVNVSSSIYGLGLASNLGYTGKGRFGFDDVTLGWQGSGGPTIKNQTVAGIATKEFYMGLFGLTPIPTNFTNYNHPFPSIMQTMRNQSVIPSTSWGYTAGNPYRLDKVAGSLTLGGYDSSRFIPNNISFSLGAMDALSLQVQSITTNDSVPLLVSPISTTLDSTVSHIWLPHATCSLFEKAFGLVWNETLKLYLINDTQHSVLQAQNPSINFTLSQEGSSSTIEIVLPYAAFDLTAFTPITSTPTRYFPLKRAANESQYLIGRTFFQEAYVIADYERRNFSVSQCRWEANMPQNIIAILPPSNNTKPSTTKKKRWTATVSGAAAGGAVAIIIACTLLEFCYLRPRRKRMAEGNAAAATALNTNNPEATKPELYGSTSIPPDGKFEADTSKHIPPVEIGENNPVAELPAREEVAIEMSAQNWPNPSRDWSMRGLRREMERRVRDGVIRPESPVIGIDYLRRTASPGVSHTTEPPHTLLNSPEPSVTSPFMGALTPPDLPRRSSRRTGSSR